MRAVARRMGSLGAIAVVLGVPVFSYAFSMGPGTESTSKNVRRTGENRESRQRGLSRSSVQQKHDKVEKANPRRGDVQTTGRENLETTGRDKRKPSATPGDSSLDRLWGSESRKSPSRDTEKQRTHGPNRETTQADTRAESGIVNPTAPAKTSPAGPKPPALRKLWFATSAGVWHGIPAGGLTTLVASVVGLLIKGGVLALNGAWILAAGGPIAAGGSVIAGILGFPVIAALAVPVAPLIGLAAFTFVTMRQYHRKKEAWEKEQVATKQSHSRPDE